MFTRAPGVCLQTTACAVAFRLTAPVASKTKAGNIRITRFSEVLVITFMALFSPLEAWRVFAAPTLAFSESLGTTRLSLVHPCMRFSAQAAEW